MVHGEHLITHFGAVGFPRYDGDFHSVLRPNNGDTEAGQRVMLPRNSMTQSTQGNRSWYKDQSAFGSRLTLQLSSLDSSVQ